MDPGTSEQKCSCSFEIPQFPRISVSLPVRMCWSRWGCRGQTESSRWFSLIAGPLQPIIPWIPCHLFSSATGTAMPFADSKCHTLDVTVVLTNNVLYFKCLLSVLSSFKCMVPFHLAWLHLLWTRKVDKKRYFKGPRGSCLNLVVFLTVFCQELCFWPEEITWRWFWQSVVKEHFRSGCFASFSVVQRFLCGFSFTKSLCASCERRNRLFNSSHMILKQPLVKEEVCSCLDPWSHPNVIFLELTCHLKIQDNPFLQ